MAKNKERIIFIDNLKCFAIFLVMLGHAIQYITGKGYDNNPVFQFIYSFHMPLFMILCGMFFRPSLNIKLKPFLIKKTNALLVPAFSWLSLRAIGYAVGGAIF